MRKYILKPGRIIVIFVIVAALLATYAAALYKLQIIDGAAYYDESANTYTTEYPVTAVRGSIYDRNGTLLISSDVTYNLAISRTALLRSENPNAALLGIINTAEEFGTEYTDTFPMTHTGPFEFSAEMTKTQKSWLKAYFEYFKIDENISGTDFFVWLKEHYGIGYTTPLSDARKIIGVRWELEIRVIVNTDEYVFAKNVSAELISAVLERGYAGVYAAASSERVYHTTSAPHLLGYLGAMTSNEEIEKYTALGYPMNALVGRSGAEQAFEEYLHGTDGVMAVTTNSSGAVTGTEMTVMPQAGKNVYLTIDIELQAAAESALASTIAEINSKRTEEEDLAEGGALAVIEVDSGKLLAGASHPGFDVSRIYENYSALMSDPLRPMYNRLTLGTYEPGSTFKMVTAMAALKSGVITPYTTIRDAGKYRAYKDYQPVCWVYPHGDHGTINVVGALENSCNYFFYTVGDKLGITAIENAARLFGLGSKTGIEINEATGTVGDADYKKNVLNERWWAADTLGTAIGQGYNLFTPLQIANYIATIANGGTNYRVTMLDSVTAHDGSSVLIQNEPEVRSVIDDSDGYLGVLRSGMRAVAKTGTASATFSRYPVPVAAKTGTVESSAHRTNNGVFVCFAPADDPEIAISVVVERGGSGSAITAAAKKVLDCYFGGADDIPVAVYEGTLLQ